jgi:SAM-dependent methyltransferase
MKIDIRDLICSIPTITDRATRLGLPDGPTKVKVAQPEQFAAALEAVMRAFRELRPGTQTLVSAAVNACRKEVGIRVVQNGTSDRGRNGQVEESLVAGLDALRAVAERNGGGLHYWGGDNYLDVALPYPNPDRDDFPEVEHLPWDERYRVLLERASWWSLRNTVFRFSDLAAMLAEHCAACGMTTVLVPSVGICVCPWLFASRGLNAIATDSSSTALAALSEPSRHPNLYSTAAYERWDISTCASFAMMPHPDHFDGMPALEVDEVREELRQQISFVVADWAHLPVPTGTIDLVFATNAVPRSSDSERVAVLEEWVRVLRPGGFVFIAQHHAGPGWGVETFMLERGFRERNFLRDDDLPKGARGGFQVRYSSG